MVHGHILLLNFPAQGHINPSLQFAKRLVRMGVPVTFAASLSVQRGMSEATRTMEGLKFAAFSDGYDDGFRPGDDDIDHFASELRKNSSQLLSDIITASADQGCPITCVVYTILVPWAAVVARDYHIPSALLCIQPAAVLDIYYYYFNGFEEVIAKNHDDPSWIIELPGLPLRLFSCDLPSLLLPTNSGTASFALPTFKELMEILDMETDPKVLVNTCDALEPEALKAIQKYNLIGIGPLIPSAFLDGSDPSDTSFGGDLFQKSRRDYMEWLNSKDESSVVYISFGSLVTLPKPQKEEMARGLLDSHRPFLWVIIAKKSREGEKEEDEERLSCMEELEQQGMIVPWCSQLEVLSHSSLGCFLTHCGWNSTLESLSLGVPVVAMPHWSDQATNAKMMTEVWKTGVRVRANEEGVVESDEIKRCVEMVMGDEEIRRNAKKWKELTREAVKEGGSSDLNLKAFVEEVGGGD